MDKLNFLTRKPALDELDLAKAQLSLLTREIGKHAATGELEISRAKTAEELAVAIVKCQSAVTSAAVTWEHIALKTRHWAH